MSQEELINMIGTPTNNDLRHLRKLLQTYKFSDLECHIIKEGILRALPKRTKQKRGLEQHRTEH